MKKSFFILFIFLISGFTQAGVISQLYIGAGPSLNMGDAPSILTLKFPGHGSVGMFYQVKDSKNAKQLFILHVSDESKMTFAISAMLYHLFISAIQEKTQRFGAIHYDDTFVIAQKVFEQYQLGQSKKELKKLTECSELLKYLRLESNYVYHPEEIEAIKPLFCK